MIPWVREKFAERRARWLAARKSTTERNKSNDGSKSPATPTTACTVLESMVSCIPEASHHHRVFDSATKDNVGGTQIQSTPSILNVRLVSPLGNVANVTFAVDTLGFDVKLEALRLFSKDLTKLPGLHMSTVTERSVAAHIKKFRLVKSRIEFDFDEQMTLADANTVENDEFVLVYAKYRQKPLSNNESLHQQPPTQADIDRATQRTPLQKNGKMPAIVNINELVLQSDVQYDIRQIIVSLAQAAAHVIGSGPYARRLIDMFMKRLIKKRRHELDTRQNLMEMGFERTTVIHALRVTNDNYAAALNWLIDNQNGIGINLSLSDSAVSPTSSGLGRQAASSNGIQDNVEILLEIIRIYCRRYIPPSSDMVQHCIEMGFTERDARQALRSTRNNYTAACEWLVTNCSKSMCDRDATLTLTKNADGLPLDSPILKALMTSPHVQMSLTNPQTLIAFLAILEDYSTMSMWLSDGETAGVIGHILRTYHEEKHILAINQFSTEGS